MSDRILAIGVAAEHERIERVAFDDPVSLAGRELVMLDPASVPELWSHLAPGADGKVATNAASDGGFGQSLVELLRRRRGEAAELLRSGGTLVCLLRPLGRPLHVRRRTPRGIAAVILHAYSWLPDHPALARLVIAAAPGKEPRAADPDHPIWKLIHAQDVRAAFEACIANEELNPHWHVVATDRLGRPVAFEVPVERGRLAFVPPIAARDAGARGELIVAHFAPPAEPEPVEATPVPEWMAECLLPGQPELEAELTDLTGQVDRLQAELAEVRARYAELTELNKLVYAGNARELTIAAAAGFRALAFEAEPLDAECLEIRAEEGRAVVAVAAATRAIESDPYWMLIRRFEGEEAPPKGIVVGNAFCDLPPAGRGAPFADLLRRGAEHRGFCLLATVELHAAMAALIDQPSDDLRRALRRAILEATGPCSLVTLLP